MTYTQRPVFLRYGVAVGALYLVLLLTLVPRMSQYLLALLFIAVFVSAWFGGLGPGVFASSLIVATAFLFFVRWRIPLYRLRVVDMAFFYGCGVLISVLLELLHGARRRLEWSNEESRRNQDLLLQSEEAMKEADRRKNEFLAVLAHELRTPLAAIKSAGQLIALKGDEAELDWSTDVIERQTHYLSRLVDDLMDVSRIAQGKVQLRREVLDLRQVVEQAADDIRPEILERQHRLSVSLPPEAIWVSADATRLRQIVLNLLMNAVKYTESGGQIQLRAEAERGGATVRVRDTGDGIPPEMLARIFEMYAQVNRTLSRSQGGLGIGLTLVRQIAELHGGSVEAQSDGVGAGSEFIVRIPCGEVPAERKWNEPRPHVVPPASRLHVLVVDDSADTAENLSRLLERSGHAVAQAHDGPSALAIARAELPHAIVLDIGLPGMDGLKVAEQIRGDARLKETALVAMSGYSRESDRRRALDAGFDDYLVKPVDLGNLLRSLERATAGAEVAPVHAASPAEAVLTSS